MTPPRTPRNYLTTIPAISPPSSQHSSPNPPEAPRLQRQFGLFSAAVAGSGPAARSRPYGHPITSSGLGNGTASACAAR